MDRQFNDIETAIIDMFTSVIDVDSAVGTQLDVLGLHLVMERDGRSDDEYRSLLKTKIFINNAGGVAEAIMEAVRMLYGCTILHYTGTAKNVTINQNGAPALLFYYNIELSDGDLMIDQNGNSLVFTIPDESAVSILESVVPTATKLTINKIS
jgi:hypothetical protein